MGSNERRLTTWNQVAPRVYMRQVYCFPYRADDDDLEPLRTHLSSALELASRHFPQIAGQVFLGAEPAGHLFISTKTSDKIPLRVLDHRETFGCGYADLEARGFPASAFVDPSFNVHYQLVEGGPGIPAAEIHARVIHGGLLLCTFVHHSITDGKGVCNFISTFAACTRAGHTHSVSYPTDIDIDPPALASSPLGEDRPFEELVRCCPEYLVLPDLGGPTAPRLRPFGIPLDSIQKTGRIFAFGLEKIEALKATVNEWRLSNSTAKWSHKPSTFACLAALTWSYATIARMGIAPGSGATSSAEHIASVTSFEGVHCDLLMPASWARRAFQHLTGYAGNAVALPVAKCSLIQLFTVACSPPETSPAAGDSLGLLVDSIETALSSVNEEFVVSRTAMFRAAPDPRMIGIDLDPRDPRQFAFNSWRHLGADTMWGIPGIGSDVLNTCGVPPDAVRRAQDAWNMGAGVVMPGQRHHEYEVLVTLDTVSMARLCSDDRWRKWVKVVS